MSEDNFNFLVIIPGIILGLGLVQVLNGLASIVQHRNMVRVYWIHLAWAGLLFLLLVQFWYVTYSWRDLGATFGSYLYYMLYPATLFAASAILVPTVELDQKIDFQSHFFSNQRWFFSICTLALLEMILRTMQFNHESLFSIDNALRLGGLSLTLSLIWVSNERFHAIAVLSCYLLFAKFVIGYSWLFP